MTPTDPALLAAHARADLCKYYEWRGQRQGRPVLAQIVTVGAVQAVQP